MYMHIDVSYSVSYSSSAVEVTSPIPTASRGAALNICCPQCEAVEVTRPIPNSQPRCSVAQAAAHCEAWPTAASSEAQPPTCRFAADAHKPIPDL